ncbi:MAG: hypothetical protein CMO81_12425 [Waddliaceae bacterium]|nr:hypothetical protein [Waddliaceae bacterium]
MDGLSVFNRELTLLALDSQLNLRRSDLHSFTEDSAKQVNLTPQSLAIAVGRHLGLNGAAKASYPLAERAILENRRRICSLASDLDLYSLDTGRLHEITQSVVELANWSLGIYINEGNELFKKDYNKSVKLLNDLGKMAFLSSQIEEVIFPQLLVRNYILSFRYEENRGNIYKAHHLCKQLGRLLSDWYRLYWEGEQSLVRYSSEFNFMISSIDSLLGEVKKDYERLSNKLESISLK